jgi:hypothetical protein
MALESGGAEEGVSASGLVVRRIRLFESKVCPDSPAQQRIQRRRRNKSEHKRAEAVAQGQFEFAAKGLVDERHELAFKKSAGCNFSSSLELANRSSVETGNLSAVSSVVL